MLSCILKMHVVGMQEYIEAVALWQYVAKGNIISLNDVQQRLTFTQACLYFTKYCKYKRAVKNMNILYKKEHHLCLKWVDQITGGRFLLH